MFKDKLNQCVLYKNGAKIKDRMEKHTMFHSKLNGSWVKSQFNERMHCSTLKAMHPKYEDNENGMFKWMEQKSVKMKEF